VEKEREGFIIYHSFIKAIRTLPKENQLELYNAIFDFSLNGKISKLEGISNTIFELILPQLKATFTKFENGKKGGRPKTETKPKDNLKLTETKPRDNRNESNINNNNNNNINNNIKKEKLEKFKKSGGYQNSFWLWEHKNELKLTDIPEVDRIKMFEEEYLADTK